MSAHAQRLFIALFALFVAADLSIAAPISIRTGQSEIGAGYSVARGSECFGITPLHVVEAQTEIVVSDSNGKSAPADLINRFADIDLAVLRIAARPDFQCAADWDDGAQIQGLIESAPLSSEKIHGRGSSTRKYYLFTGHEGTMHFRMRPQAQGDRAAPGDSGSPVYAAPTRDSKRIVGIIASVDATNGQVTVLRQDAIHSFVKDIVLDRASKTVLLYPFVYRNQEYRNATIAAMDVLARRGTLRVSELPSGNNRYGRQPPFQTNGADYAIAGYFYVINVRTRTVRTPTVRCPFTGATARILCGGNSRRNNSVYEAHIELELKGIDSKNQVTSHFERLRFEAPAEGDRRYIESLIVEDTVRQVLPKLLEKLRL